MTSFSPVEAWSVLGDMSLAGHIEHSTIYDGRGANSTKTRPKRAKAAAPRHTKAADESVSSKPTSQLRLEAVLKQCQAFCGHPTRLEAPPGILLPVGFGAPPGLSSPDACHPALPPVLLLPVGFKAPPGLALPNGCHPGLPPGLSLPNKDGSGSDGLIETDADDTSVSTGSMKVFGDSDSEETASEAEEGFPMKADAPCFRNRYQ